MSVRWALLVVGLVAVGGLLAGHAGAPAADGPLATPWSAPSSLARSPLGTRLVSPALAFASQGAIAMWREVRANGASRQYAASLRRGGGLGPQRVLAELVVGPRAYGRDRVVALVEVSERSPRVRVVFGSTGGRFGRTHTILRTAAGYYGSGTRIAADRDGRVAVVHRLERRDGSSRIVLVERAPGGRFGRPTLIAEQRACQAQICPHDAESGYGTDISVAIGARGAVLVAWQYGAWVDARVRRAGHRMGPITRIGRYGRVWGLETAMSARGAAWVAWFDHPVGGERSGVGPMSIRVATKPARARRFGPLRELDHVEEMAFVIGQTVWLALDPAGRAFMAWHGPNAKLATLDASGRPLATRELGGGDVQALATSSRPGESLVLWACEAAIPDGVTQLHGALTTGGDDVTGRETIGPLSGIDGVAATIDPRDGSPTVLWAQRVPADLAAPARRTRGVLRVSRRQSP